MNKISSLFYDICEPNPKSIPDDLERKIQAKRNQNFLLMMATFLALKAIHVILTHKATGFPTLWFMLSFSSILIVFCLTCRSKFALFRAYYSIVITFMSPIALYFEKESIHACWAGVNLSPIFLLYHSGCHLLYVVQVLTQILFMHVMYKPQMTQAIDFTSSEELAETLTNSTTFSVIFSTLMAYHIGVSLQNTYKQQITLAENKAKQLEAQKTFILSFSHEIRNLINTLTGNIQLSLLQPLSTKVKSYLEDAESGASLLIQLINNILDTGNLDLGELDINSSSEKRIHCTLMKMWGMCTYLLKSKKLNGKLRIAKNLPTYLKIDHERLLQILVNLVVNAAKFTDKGSVDVKIEWIAGVSEVTEESFSPSPFDDEDEGIFEKDKAFSVLTDDFMVIGLDTKEWPYEKCRNKQESGIGMLKISITDTGCGVLPDNISRVFDKFSDNIFGDNSSQRLGTTIGLYVTKQLCNMMGGDIKAFSKMNRGTSFLASIPCEAVTSNSQEMSVGTLASLDQPRELTAMLVDDLDFNITVLSNYLQRMNIKVETTACNGLEAYNKYVQSTNEGKRPNIVTMDVEMPVMNGKVAAQKIREYEKENGLDPCFLIMISGNVSESEIRECLWHNGNVVADRFVKKPAAFGELNRIITDHFCDHNPSQASTNL